MDLMHVFKALDKELAAKDTENLLLQYRVEDLEKKLKEAEDENQRLKTAKDAEKKGNEVA